MSWESWHPIRRRWPTGSRRRHGRRKRSQQLGISTYLPFPAYRFFSLEKACRKSLNLFGRREKKVAFFYGCFLNFNRPDIGRKIRNLLIALGMEVVLPPQTCCGLPALGNADLQAAKGYAARNVATLTPYIDAGYDIVYSCTSCGLTLTNDYPGILNVRGGKKIAENSYNVYEYILNLVEEESVVLNLGRPAEKGCLPCALPLESPRHRLSGGEDSFLHPGTGMYDRGRSLLRAGGKLRLQSINPGDRRRRSAGKAAQAILRSNPDVVMADCGACRMQLGFLTGLPALDPVELIGESLQNAGNPLDHVLIVH